MAKFYDEEGKEIPGLTQEEFDAKLVEEKGKLETDFNTKIEESNTKVTTLEADLVKAKEDLKITNPKGDDFKNLRDITKKLEDDLAIEKGERSKAIDSIKASKVDGLVKKLSGNDVELEKKIRFNLDTTLSGVKTDTDEELNKKLVDAYKLSTDSTAINPLDNIMSGGSHSSVSEKSDPVEFSSNEKVLGGKLGITGDDYKKYGTDKRIK